MWQCQLSQPDCRCYRVDGYSLLKRLPLHPLIGPRCPVQSVGQWLDNIGLVQYENHLLSNGFDNVQFMVSVSFTIPSLSFPVASFLSVSFFSLVISCLLWVVWVCLHVYLSACVLR